MLLTLKYKKIMLTLNPKKEFSIFHYCFGHEKEESKKYNDEYENALKEGTEYNRGIVFRD